MTIKKTKISLALVALVPITLACGLNSAQQGAVIGAGAGGAAGAAVGYATGSTVRGAIIGAAVGGVAGAVIGHQMDRQAEELAYELPGAIIQRVGEGITVTFPEGLLFAFDSDELSMSARENMRAFAGSLLKYENTRTLIVGHTDSQGSDDYNQQLSQRRALSTARFLTSQGVPDSRISTTGRGELEPIATNGTDSGRRDNRRVEVAIFSNGAG